MKFGKAKCVGVGLPVVAVLLSIAAGGVDNASTILFVSVVCTAGVGLVFWALVCWVAGWVILSSIGAFRKKPAVEKTSVHREQIALGRYMRHRAVQGINLDLRLRKEGWSDEEIQKARQSISEQDS